MPCLCGPLCRVLIDGDKPAPGGVTFRVLPPMPRLEVAVAGLPATLLAGEVVHCSMRLRNTGAMTLQHLSMAAAAGAGIFIGGAEQGGGSSGAAGAAGASGAQAAASPTTTSASAGEDLQSTFRQGVSVLSLPTTRLGVGQELTLRVWFRWVGLAGACPRLALCEAVRRLNRPS